MRPENAALVEPAPVAAPGARSSTIPVLPRGTPARRTYVVLSAVAVLATIGFATQWPGPLHLRHPFLYGLATLATLYYVAVWFARWFSLRNMQRPADVEAEPGLKVAVATSFVPELESLAMLEQTVRSLVALDYPHDTWVLDEGDDPRVRDLCRRLGAQHFSRKDLPRLRTPKGKFAAQSKHGNYNAWLEVVGYQHYEIIATFDPDHVAERNYLTRLLGYFRDPTVGYVQAPQVYYNQAASFIARGAAEETYAYYSSHLMASYGLGHTVVVGSHSVHRTAALRAAGGMPAHDAEDLYLTMVYRAGNWRGIYRPEILAMGLAPVTWAAYLRQQVRWSRAVLDLKRHALPELAGKLTPLERALNLFHGVYYLRPLLLLAFYVVLMGMLVQNEVVTFLRPGPILALGGLALVLNVIDRFRARFYLDPAREAGVHWRAQLLQLAKAPHLAIALIDVLLDRKVTYITTPKVAGAGPPVGVLARPHIALAGLVAIALGVGYRLHGPIDPPLLAVALAAMGISLSLAWTEMWTFPPPFDPELLPARRREMAEVLPDSYAGITETSPQAAR